MRNLLFVFAFFFLFVCFLMAGINAQSSSVNMYDVISQLLDKPAPKPPFGKKKDEEAKEKTRPREFYTEKNIPPDDAPIEDLLDYCVNGFHIDRFFSSSKASTATQKRLLEFCEENPDKLISYL